MKIKMVDGNHRFTILLPTAFLFGVLRLAGKEAGLSKRERKALLRKIKGFRRKNGPFCFLEVLDADGGIRIDL